MKTNGLVGNPRPVPECYRRVAGRATLSDAAGARILGGLAGLLVDDDGLRLRQVEVRVHHAAAEREQDPHDADGRRPVVEDEDAEHGERDLVQRPRDRVRRRGRDLHAPEGGEGHAGAHHGHQDEAHVRLEARVADGGAHVTEHREARDDQERQRQKVVVEDGAVAADLAAHVAEEGLHVEHVRHGEEDVGEGPEEAPRGHPLVRRRAHVCTGEHEAEGGEHPRGKLPVEHVGVAERGEHRGEVLQDRLHGDGHGAEGLHRREEHRDEEHRQRHPLLDDAHVEVRVVDQAGGLRAGDEQQGAGVLHEEEAHREVDAVGGHDEFVQQDHAHGARAVHGDGHRRLKAVLAEHAVSLRSAVRGGAGAAGVRGRGGVHVATRSAAGLGVNRG
mmetsp:Transcript_54971/g.169407  ORF Transcript_54971/g.169407 Transcript_54971/m.169407 type:complete len:388 (-) Transcript_54971:230-1393(-)